MSSIITEKSKSYKIDQDKVVWAVSMIFLAAVLGAMWIWGKIVFYHKIKIMKDYFSLFDQEVRQTGVHNQVTATTEPEDLILNHTAVMILQNQVLV